MRRTLLCVCVLGLVLIGTVTARSSGGGSDGGSYRVAAIFDTAKGMDPTQLVKIAGARVGTVEDVQLVDGPKARLILEIDPEFGPFRDDATCQILPEGLISEYFVQCDPGNGRKTLATDKDGMPTVPVSRTQVPVSLQQVLDVFSAPVDQRIRAFVNELGLSVAGRGADLNALIRRANPALEKSRRVLDIVNGQRRQLVSAVEQTDRVLARLARGKEDLRRFVNASADLTATTADHRHPLGQAINRLPGLLDEVKPSMQALDQAMRAGTPLLAALDESAPALGEINRTVPAFADDATPALRALGGAADTGRDTIKPLRPIIADLRRTTDAAVPFAKHLDDFMVHLRDNGGIELVLDTIYSLTSVASAYDGVSHIVAIVVNLFPRCFLSPGVPGCTHRYNSPGMGRIPVNTVGTAPIRKSSRSRGPKKEAAKTPAAPTPGSTAPSPAGRDQLPLDLQKLLPELDLAPLQDQLGGKGSGQPAPDATEQLLDYILG